MADARIHALSLDVLIQRTDEERRLHALSTDVLVQLVRTWGDIEDAWKIWYQNAAAPTAKTLRIRKLFEIGPGYIAGGTLTWQADHTCTAYINGAVIGTYVASGPAVEPVTMDIPGNKLHGGTNLLVSQAGLRGMLECRLDVIGSVEEEEA
jgi:hypothetical protein